MAVLTSFRMTANLCSVTILLRLATKVVLLTCQPNCTPYELHRGFSVQWKKNGSKLFTLEIVTMKLQRLVVTRWLHKTAIYGCYSQVLSIWLGYLFCKSQYYFKNIWIVAIFYPAKYYLNRIFLFWSCFTPSYSCVSRFFHFFSVIFNLLKGSS